jgi:putative ABC transport system permease protein
VTPGFFEETGARLLEGRWLTDADAAGAQPVAVVDDLLARRAFAGESAVGRTILVDPGSTGHPTTTVTIVGVVGHLRLRSLVEDLTEQVYFSAGQVARNPLAYAVRTTGDPASLVPAVRQALAGIDPQIPIFDVRPFDEYLRGAAAGRRFTMMLAVAFAVAAGLLAAIGVYGVVAYAIARRRNEFGVRLALGARPSQLIARVMAEGARLTAMGFGLGALASLGVAPLLRSQLFGVTPADPVTYAVAIATLGLAMAIACLIPARLVASSSPLDALRQE